MGASASVAGDTEERAELVAACGHGKNGALAVLQRGIQPELVTEVEAGTLPGLRGTWTAGDCLKFTHALALDMRGFRDCLIMKYRYTIVV